MSKHSELAIGLFKQGYNCSQAVFGAFCDETGMSLEDALRLSSSFGAGMGKLREVCGAVTGMFMAAGCIYGYADPLDEAAKAEHYALIQSLAHLFKEENKSISCRDLLGLDLEEQNPIPEARTEHYYQERPCVELVGSAAEILDKLIESRGVIKT
ncbi:MAG: C-GCAxxG-C-C family protein [Eubacteriales bacterium]